MARLLANIYDLPRGECMRGESWIVDVPPEVQAASQHSEQDVALESERLETLISTLRRRGAAQSRASGQAGFESPRVRAAREMLGQSLG